MNLKKQIFSEMILQWYDQHGRKDLPWQVPRSAYRVWLSEMMLQQTQVKTVIPYFNRFISRFPTLQTLAVACEDEVMALWAGLGYYSRARNLHKTAKILHAEFQNEFPQNLESLNKLPGIGPSTAAAIMSLAFGQSTAIMDGNVKRVLCRYFGIDGNTEERATQQKLWQLANDCMPKTRCADYTQAIMDMGAMCCTRTNPQCNDCPLNRHCIAYLTQRVADYPKKKLKAKIPEKLMHVLVIHKEDRSIYLEKRPSNGIWGGLWCLPCIDKIELTQPGDLPQPFMTLAHTLTHMRLNMRIMVLTVLEAKTLFHLNFFNETDANWVKENHMTRIGLPKPIKHIIEKFYALKSF